jgi:hypothetical protein
LGAHLDFWGNGKVNIEPWKFVPTHFRGRWIRIWHYFFNLMSLSTPKLVLKVVKKIWLAQIDNFILFFKNILNFFQFFEWKFFNPYFYLK